MEVYLDNAAATKMDSHAQRAMVRALRIEGNPSSFNEAGRRALSVLNGARAQVAKFLHARADEIIFCSSGSEANTLGILGTTRVVRGRNEILTTRIEHPSVLSAVRILEGTGTRVTYLPTDKWGTVAVEDIVSRLRRGVRLVSIMYANNEIGTIQPIAKIGRAIDRWRRAHQTALPLLHVDACQATAYLDMDVQRLGADLVTLNGAKAYGPHGSAVLYVRRGVTARPLIVGGSQEGGRRAGTEDVASAVGLAAALGTVRPTDAHRVAVLRDRLMEGISRVVPDARFNGPVGNLRLANNVNVSIPDTDSESLLLELDRCGIRAGSGSACTAHSVEPSHVLTAVGTPREYLDGVIRFSLSRTTTRAQIDRVLKVLPGVVSRIRARRSRVRVS